MTAIRAILLVACVTMSLQPAAGHAHEGHDGAAPTASAMPGANIPRIEAQSDLFEIVGVVQNGLMTLFLDRYATNEPVIDAKIDIEAGPLKGSAQANANGTYTFRHVALAHPGQFPITFTITAGRDGDLLAGDLVIVDPEAAAAHPSADPWWKHWSWVAATFVVVAGITIAWWLRRKRVRGITR